MKPELKPPSHLRLISAKGGFGGSDMRGLGDLGDEQLVFLLREGDTAAFETLYRRHAAFAINLAVRVQGNAHDVEDIVHDAFVRAAQRSDGLREAGAFRAWLGSIVVRLVKSRMRRAKIVSIIGFGKDASLRDEVDIDKIVSPEASPEARAEVSQLYRLLMDLPADDRIAWALRYIEHLDLQGVSTFMSCSLATAKRRIARAQERLLERYQAVEATIPRSTNILPRQATHEGSSNADAAIEQGRPH